MCVCVCVCEIERFDSIRLYKHIKVMGGGSGCTPVKQRQLVRLVSQLDLVTDTLYKLI